MSIPDLCIYFIVAILSVAYPILLQVISRLDEKYSSTVIVELFEQEPEWRWFRNLLIITLVFTGSYAVINLVLWLNKIPAVNQVVVYGLFTSTAILILFFLMFVNKILMYYTPAKILDYFIKQKETKDYVYFKALGDILLFFSIEQQKEVSAKKIQKYYYQAFQLQREQQRNKPVEYPQPFYELVGNLVTRLAAVSSKKFAWLEYRTVGGIWLIGEQPEFEISESTYRQLWHNLVSAINFNRNDMVMYFWQTVHQHFEYHLRSIPRNYSDDEKVTVATQATIQKRVKEQDNLLEFIQALLGLLLYKNRSSCINRIFKYTTSLPPTYVLLPLSMTAVFKMFFKFWDSSEENFPFITLKYWFPETEGINSQGLVKLWSSKAAALLFLRQYTIVPYFITMSPLSIPDFPEKKLERKIWIENIDQFKILIKELYSNRNLLDEVGFSFLSDEWCKEQNKPTPIDFIEDVKKALKALYQQNELEQKLSDEKVCEFENSTKSIIGAVLEPYFKVLSNPIQNDYQTYSINGIKGVLEKNAFVEDQEADYENFHSIYAQTLSHQLEEGIQNIFSCKITQAYHLKREELFSAIDRLGLNAEEHVIINFGADLSLFHLRQNVNELTPKSYKGITIATLPFYKGAANKEIYIIKKEDLPYIDLEELPQDEINKYNLKKLSTQYQIYGSIIDLFRNQELLLEHSKGEDIHELSKKVLIYIGMHLVIKWKNNVSLVRISLYNEWIINGESPISPNEVKSFEIAKPSI